MAGTDTVRGITFQHCHAILIALDVAADPGLISMRVEGQHDIVDIEVHAAVGSPEQPTERVCRAVQVKSRSARYGWSRSELVQILKRWVEQDDTGSAVFELLTNGKLGPSTRDLFTAIEAVRRGDRTTASHLLSIGEADPLLDALPRVSVSYAPESAETLLFEAEREVLSMLAPGRVESDAAQEASDAVDRLFKLISLRAGLEDPSRRLITASEIVDTIRAVALVPPADRWTRVRIEYVEAALAMDLASIMPQEIRQASAEPRADASLPLSALLRADSPIVLAGRTGSGKTTAAQSLAHMGAADGRCVIVCHLEAYASARLDSLVASALGAVIGRPVSRAVGRQCLNDPETLVVIDGASETPAAVRHEAAKETTAHLSAGVGATLAFFGRDARTIRQLLPSQIPMRPFSVVPLKGEARRELARRELRRHRGRSAQTAGQDWPSDADVRRAVSRVEHALGDSAGNPMLFELAVQLHAQGVPFADRASLYGASIEAMSARSNAADIHTASLVLGVVFAQLLDEGRRYANPLEWERLTIAAASTVASQGFAADIVAVNEAVLRSGLTNVVTTAVGSTALRGAIHDSFADYLAAVAHACGVSELPTALTATDEQRVLFFASLKPPSHALCTAIARDIPLTLARLPTVAARSIPIDAPARIADLIALLCPTLPSPAIRMWRDQHAVFVQANALKTGWDESGDGAQHVSTMPTLVWQEGDTAVSAAVRLWRLVLNRVLKPRSYLSPRRARDIDEAIKQLESHTGQTRDEVQTVLQAFPQAAQEPILARIGPLGLTALIARYDAGRGAADWRVHYRYTHVSTIAAMDPTADEESVEGGVTSLDHLLASSPQTAAAEKVRNAVNELIGGRWL